MANIFLNSSDQGIIVFKIWKSLIYKIRLLISFSFILTGLAIQYLSFNILPGVILIFLGNLLLLPSGYTNRVNLGHFNPQFDWEKVEKRKLDEWLSLDRRIRKWDRSAIDISNALGGFVFFIFLGIIGFVGVNAFIENDITTQIITVDALVLLIPYWVTGLRSIFTLPKLTMKINLINKLIAQVEERLQPHKIEYFMLLKGKKPKIPIDIKFKVNIANQHKKFLGFYGQVTINNVQSTSYPYFYVVLVARKNFGLQQAFQSYANPKEIIKEFKQEKDVEVLVIRQNTKAVIYGYRTKDSQVQSIFLEGLQLAENAAVK